MLVIVNTLQLLQYQVQCKWQDQDQASTPIAIPSNSSYTNPQVHDQVQSQVHDRVAHTKIKSSYVIAKDNQN